MQCILMDLLMAAVPEFTELLELFESAISPLPMKDRIACDNGFADGDDVDVAGKDGAVDGREAAGRDGEADGHDAARLGVEASLSRADDNAGAKAGAGLDEALDFHFHTNFR